jgi:O-antigen ligase
VTTLSAGPQNVSPGRRAVILDWLPSAQLVLLAMLAFGLAASISVSQLTLLVLAGWLIVARRAGRLPRLRLPLRAPMAAFAIWSVVAALASARPVDSLAACKHLLNLAALFVVTNALSDPAVVRRFATWLVLAVAIAAAVGIAQVAACPTSAGTTPWGWPVDTLLRKCARARGFYSIYMTLGGVLALALTFALPLLVRLRAEPWWLGPAWVVTGAGLALTYVRGAWVGFAIGAAAAVSGLGRRSLGVALGVVLLVIALLFALPGVNARLKTVGSAADDTTRDRLAMVDAGWRLLLEHPVTGVGPGQVKHLYPTVATPQALRRSTSHLHNTPLQIAVERGLVGLGIWLWIFASFIMGGVVVLRRLPAEAARDRLLVLGSMASVIAFVVGGLFEYNFGDTEVLLVALTVMAVPFALDRASPAPAGL